MSKPILKTLDLDTLKSFSIVFDQLREGGLLTPSLTMEQLNGASDDDQKQVIRQILALDPKDYDVTIPYIGLEPVPADLVAVRGQTYTKNGSEKVMSDQLVPQLVYDAFVRMNEAFKSDHPGRTLLIESAYRSPASQIVAFINWCLRAYGGDIAKTIRHASPPAYSQHTSASKTALDIKSIDGSPSNEDPEDFTATVEYKWLCDHANKFGFYESWPEGNGFGMRAEPWHWQYKGGPMTKTKAQFDEWITEYGKAWTALDPDAVMKLIDSEELTYYESTFNEPTQSWDKVNELWQVVPSNQKEVTFWHEILMIDGDAVLAHVKVTRTMVPSGEKQDIDAAFMFRLNERGLCTYFRQWRMLR